MIEFSATFCGVDREFKYSVEKIQPIMDFLS